MDLRKISISAAFGLLTIQLFFATVFSKVFTELEMLATVVVLFKGLRQ